MIGNKIFKDYFNQAKKFVKQGKIDEAIATYQQVFTLDPNQPTWVCKQFANTLLKSDRLLEVYQELSLSKKSQNLDSIQIKVIFYKLGEKIVQSCIQQGQLDRAKNCFLNACRNEPSNAWHFFYLGNAFHHEGQYAEAINNYQKSIEVQENFFEPYWQLSNIFLLKTEDYWERGFQYCIKALQVEPNNPKVNLLCAKWLDHLAKSKSSLLEKSLKSYQDILESLNSEDLGSPALYFNLGKACLQVGKLSESIAYNQKSIYYSLQKKSPDFVRNYWESSSLTGPNFLIVGFMKCGTTALFDYLTQHPQILPSIIKETSGLHKFIQQPEREYENLNYYLSLFPPLPSEGHWITGEACISYINPKISHIVKKYFPNTKILIVLRNPVTRAISEYYFRVKHGNESVGIEEIFNSEIEQLIKIDDLQFDNVPNRNIGKNYITKGLYLYYIKKWLSLFPKEQVLILKSEDLGQNTGHVMKQVYNFLDLPDFPQVQYPPKNKGTYLSKANEILISRLSEFYRPHNQKLEKFLERKFNWN